MLNIERWTLRGEARAAAQPVHKPRRLLRLWLARAGVAAALALGAGAASAATHITVSAYDINPYPAAKGEAIEFTVKATANAAVSGAELAVELPANVDFSAATAPAGCSFNLGVTPKTLNCSKANVANGSTWEVQFSGKGGAAVGVTNTKATVMASGSDANDSTKQAEIIAAANLNLVKTGPGSALSGQSISFTLNVTNAGPDEAKLLELKDTLPSDFELTSISSTDWTCNSGTVTCTRASLAAGVSTTVMVTGKVKASAGTLTNSAEVKMTGQQVRDPNLINNTGLAGVSISPAVDLAASKTMVSSRGTTTYTLGETVTLTLGATNNGVIPAEGVFVTDTVPIGFTNITASNSAAAACSIAGNTIRCPATGGVNLNAGNSLPSYTFTMTAPDTAQSGSNTATVANTSPTEGKREPATVNYTVVEDYARLLVGKSKSPSGRPVTVDDILTSTITVRRDPASTAPASGTITVSETLSPNETFVSAAAPWTCTGVAVGATGTLTCTHTLTASLTGNQSAPNLVIQTKVTEESGKALWQVNNRACMDNTHTPRDSSGQPASCAGPATGIDATKTTADLAITKTASAASLAAVDDTLTYTLTVTNSGPNTAPTVKVADTLNAYFAGGVAPSTGVDVMVNGVVDSKDPSLAVCPITSGKVNCTFTNLASGTSKTITITLTRPFKDGTISNTATVSSPDAYDPNLNNNNSATVSTTIAAKTDVLVQSVSASPAIVPVGVKTTITTEIKNQGPSTAQDTKLYQEIVPLAHMADPRMQYVAGSAQIRNGNGSCTYKTFVAPEPYPGSAGLVCDIGSANNFGSNTNLQLTFDIIPTYGVNGAGYPDSLTNNCGNGPPTCASYSTAATITTTTPQNETNNDVGPGTVYVQAKEVDLAITIGDPDYDPVGLSQDVVYTVSINNRDASRATGVQFKVVPPVDSAPVGGTMKFKALEAGQFPAGTTCTGPDLAGAATCQLDATLAQSILEPGATKTFKLKFETAAANPVSPPADAVVFTTTASVWSYETGIDPFIGDRVPANNVQSEPTTALPITDLTMLTKTVSKSPIMLNEPFAYTLSLKNNGPSAAKQVVITDTLPTGLRVLLGSYGGQTYAMTVKKGGSVLVSGYSCSPAVVNNATAINCSVDNVGKDETVELVLPVIAREASYSGGFNTNRTNTAKVDVPRDSNGTPTTSLDPNPSNNEASVDVQVQKATVSGTVVFAQGSPIQGGTAWQPVTDSVTFTLSGMDAWGNAISKTETTSTGSFSFDNLPPSDGAGYQVVQTQPSGYADYLETGPSGVVLPAATCDGTANCAASAVANTIGTVVVTEATPTVTGLVFQELKQATVSGRVFEDANNNGVWDAGESVISAGSQIKITGRAYNGQSVEATVNSDASGYSFNGLPPSDSSGYQVVQTSQPTGYTNGQAGVQPTGDQYNVAGQVNAGNRYDNTISTVVVHSAGVATGNNFGELKPASISGYTFIDGNKNAMKETGETAAVTGMTVTLSGRTSDGQDICTVLAAQSRSCTLTTDANGFYEFKDIPPGTYAVAVTPLPGVTHVGAQVGAAGGKVNGATKIAGEGVVSATATQITDVVLTPGFQATGYNFGQTGEGLSGRVYVDLNNNGQWDTGEPGIAGVTITLSGNASDGRSVCAVILPSPCQVTTDATGSYAFNALPNSDTTGYTLTEQAQTTPPLNGYADGAETVGNLGGGAGTNDAISGIKLSSNYGTNYNFGEKASDLPGRVVVKKEGGDTPLPGVEVTISGTTVDGQEICALLTAQSRSCKVTTGSDGKFVFPGLPAGSYTLTEKQPEDYTDHSNTLGNAGGTGGVLPNGDSQFTGITLTPGTPSTEYEFAEKPGVIAGRVYHDQNASGARDSGEPGIPGVIIKLTGTSKAGQAITREVQTDANGEYRFADLPNGSYTVTEVQPEGWLDGATHTGLVDGSACTGCSVATPNTIGNIVLTADKGYTEFNFGEVKGASISGNVYHDTDENGILDPSEGLEGVTVTLTGKDHLGNPVNVTITTDADGKYSFPNLPPSDTDGYTITETQPADIGDFAQNGAQLGTIDGQFKGSSSSANVITGVVLKSGESGEAYNFREKASSLSGAVYRDDNDDGIKGSNEPGLPGVTVTLTGTSTSGQTVTRTAVTDSEGNYRFVGLPSGTYEVVETQPTGMLDGKETAGSKGGNVNNGQTCDAASCNTIGSISLGVAENAAGYLFGERGGSLSGTVYVDANNDGQQSGDDELGLPGVKVTLTGVTESGEDICTVRGAAFCTVVSDANGHYKFEGVPPGTYSLSKSQNQVNELFDGQYADGKETPGVVGGSVENRYFGTQPGYNTIGDIRLSSDGITQNAGNIGGYLLGVRPSTPVHGLVPPIVNGYVYMDRTHDRIRDPMNTEGQSGWTVNLRSSTGLDICTVQTDGNGFYQFDNLHCDKYPAGLPTSDSLGGGATFEISFSKDGNVLPSMASSGDGAGQPGAAKITGLVLRAADEVVEQNLPLDPEGVVYDAVTRLPVTGAVISIRGPVGFDPSVHLIGGTAAQIQTTGTDGRYSFVLQNAYPTGVYELLIDGVPATYLPGESVMIPACKNTLQVTMLPGGVPALMQAQRDAPGVGQAMHDPAACVADTTGFNNVAPFAPGQQTTQYWLRFHITRGGSSEVLNNHIPLDPLLAGGAIVMTKTTPKVNVTKGELVPYTLTATNRSGGALANVQVRDFLPPGFRYRTGSATYNGLPLEPVVVGRELTYPEQNFAIDEKKTYQLLLMVGAGVGDGEYVNQVWALNRLVGERISNVANAVVRVVPDPLFDCSDLIGTVFDDKNANGYQDQGEVGIPNVRVATARGLLVTTDADGRFHVACAAIPQADRGSNFVMKLDERTLPSGFRVTSENPRDVRVTRGKMVKLNFGATVHKVLRLEVDGRAFAEGGNDLAPQWQAKAQELLLQLVERPTVLRLAYRLNEEEAPAVAKERLKALTKLLRQGYAEQAKQRKKDKDEDTPPLVIETESFEHKQVKGVR